MRTIILDTDIGNDVDDIFALIMLAKMTDFKLLGVTTVYGDTKQEAQMTRYILDKIGRVDVPVIPGEGRAINANQDDIILRGDHITGGFPEDLANVRVNSHSSAVDFLIEQSRLYDGELELLCIGPLTNLAMAIQKDPGFSARIKKITLMAGLISPEKNPEWFERIRTKNGEYNIICDEDASRIVFETRIPMILIPLDVTTKVHFTKIHREYFSQMPFGLGEILSKELSIWWNRCSRIESGYDDFKSNPHDPMAVVALNDEDFFTFEKGTISIGPSHGLMLMTLFRPEESGHVKVATGVNPEILNEIVRRIVK